MSVLPSPLPALPVQPNSVNLQKSLDGITSTLGGALSGLLHTYGQWLALAAPFAVGLLLLELVVSRLLGTFAAGQSRAESLEAFNVDYIRQHGHMPGWTES